MKTTAKFNLIYVLFAAFGVVSLHSYWMATQAIAPIPYSDFQTYLKDGKLKEVVVTSQNIRGEFVAPIDGKSKFVTTRAESELATMLDGYKVKFSGQVDSTFLPTLLSWVVPILLFFALWTLLARVQHGGRVVGLLTMDNVGEFMAIQAALGGARA